MAPGPSATAVQAEQLRQAGIPLGVVGNAYQLALEPAFLAATDCMWWRKHPEAKALSCPKYSMHAIPSIKQIRLPTMGVVNSGVLGLECAKRQGATRILMLGFDMAGTHFFGPYTNGLSNTTPHKRAVHLKQFKTWGRENRDIEVFNCTEGSALTCFPMARLDDFLRSFPLAHPRLSGDLHSGACEHHAEDGAEALRQTA